MDERITATAPGSRPGVVDHTALRVNQAAIVAS